MSNINMNPKSKRDNGYWQKVVAFITARGPNFTLKGVTHVDEDGHDCQCCGKRNLQNLFWVTGEADGHLEERFIGSECQLFVLGTEGVVPANKLRTLPLHVLHELAGRYGVVLDASMAASDVQVAAAVIKARRSFANKQGHTSRKALAAVPTSN